MSTSTPILDKQKQEQKQQVEPPKKYHVVILNDDFSTFDMVIDVCTTFFGQTEEQAQRTATDVHTKGKGVAGTYTKDVAETKSTLANDYCKFSEQPLMSSVIEA